MCGEYYTTGAVCGAGTAYLSRALEFVLLDL